MRLEIVATDKQSKHICEEYWQKNEEGEFVLTVQALASMFGFTAHGLIKIVKLNSYVWLSTIRCIRCEEPYRYRTRCQYQQRKRHSGAVCNACISTEIQTVADRKKAALVKFRNLNNKSKACVDELDLKSSIYLLSTINALADEGLCTIQPIGNFAACTLSPDSSYDYEILKHLVDSNLITLSMSSSLAAITLYENDEINLDFKTATFDLAFGQYQITNLSDSFFSNANIEKIRNLPDFIDLCKAVQLNECLCFLKSMLLNHRLFMSPGVKTQQIITQCLERFSVAQVYNFMWRACRDAAAYYMRGSISKQQAANSVVGAISKNMERALANGWAVKPYNRNFNMPQSALSRVVFNTVLGTDDGGFKSLLTELTTTPQ